MKIVNRAFISVKQKQAFWDWAKTVDSEIEFSENDDLEKNIYLIDEDFFDIEPIIEQNYKKIFNHELYSITEDEDLWPKNLKLADFLTWFELDFGSLVVDLEKSSMEFDEIDLD